MVEAAKPKRKPPAAGIGRKKGVPNKTTGILKEAILRAAENAGGKDGMVGYLTEQAQLNPGPFMGLLAKVLPMQVNHADAEGGKITIAIRDMTRE